MSRIWQACPLRFPLRQYRMNFFLFQCVQLFNIHGLDFPQWDQFSSNIKFIVLRRFTHIYQIYAFSFGKAFL